MHETWTPRAPFHARGLLDFLRLRAVPGVEAVEGRIYRRAVLGEVVEIELESHAVTVRAETPEALAACRALADPDADPVVVDARLAAVPALAPLVAAAPGLRVPGTVDAAELALRAVLGQQVSVEAARTLAARLSAEHGDALDRPRGGVERSFIAPAALAMLDPETLPMPRARGRALVGLAGALADGMTPTREALLPLPGIGPWTADYVALRALADRDVLLLSDLGVKRALHALGVRDGRSLAAACSPFGSYATLHLWRSLSAP